MRSITFAVAVTTMTSSLFGCALTPEGAPEVDDTEQALSPQACGSLGPGESLLPGQGISTCDGNYRLIYQNDGNLVLYRVSDGLAVSSAATGGTAPGRALMQTDGNFVVYDAKGVPRYNTYTYGNPGARLEVANYCAWRVMKGNRELSCVNNMFQHWP
jgi:hypothetical protein